MPCHPLTQMTHHHLHKSIRSEMRKECFAFPMGRLSQRLAETMAAMTSPGRAGNTLPSKSFFQFLTFINLPGRRISQPGKVVSRRQMLPVGLTRIASGCHSLRSIAISCHSLPFVEIHCHPSLLSTVLDLFWQVFLD